MTEAGTIIPARMSLSFHAEQRQIVCAFSCNGEELSRGSTPLPDEQLLESYRTEINAIAAGFTEVGSAIQSMISVLREIIPGPVTESVGNAVRAGPEANILALEIMLNDPEILDPYPWELLSDQGLLIDEKVRVVVWRSISASKPPSQSGSSVLLVGSASRDMISTDAEGEISVLADILRERVGIRPFRRPRITFSEFVNNLAALRPCIVHIIVHGNVYGFQFQEEPGASRGHVNIPPQELGAYLEGSNTARLVLLNACHSASSSVDRFSMARRIAKMSSAATIGMSAEIPNDCGFDFSKSLFQALASGESLLEAFGTAVHAIRQENKFNILWSAPVMYAPAGSNVTLFPSDPRGRMRLRLQEIGRQLRQLDSEAVGLAGGGSSQAADAAPSSGFLKIRLGYIRDLLAELNESELKGPENLRARELLKQVKNHADPALEQLQSMLGNLNRSLSSREHRDRSVRSIRLALSSQHRALAQLELEFSDTR